MSEVTIAILSAVEPPLPECLAAVGAQEGGPYRVVHIKDVFPMSAAFNAMILSTDAKYVVQVDGDIILRTWAVRKLVDDMIRSFWCYANWGQLQEKDFGLGGAVRCWRRSTVQRFGFRDKRTVDRDLHHRVRWIGMRRLQVKAAEPFGLHQPRTSPFSRFHKARGDVAKWRHLGRHDMIARLLSSPLDEFGLAGACSGLRMPPDELAKSKDLKRDWEEFSRAFN